ncbi:MAG: CPBP family intramembrane glutamic endopeptidase [Promethearchaeota archaeon]
MVSRTLIKFKKLATPLFALVAILFTIFVVQSPSIWFNFQPRIQWPFLENFKNFENSDIFGNILLLLCAFTLGWIVIAEILSALIIMVLHVDVSQQSFLTAWTQRDWYGLLVQFPCIILLEEILFRGIALFYLDQVLPYREVIWLSAVVFGLYHLHIFLLSHQWGITIVYILSSTLLGVILAILFPSIGILGAWGYHILAVFYIYVRWIARIQREGKKEAE